jgi:hypothetical protein
MGLSERAARALPKEKEGSSFMQTERDNLLEAMIQGAETKASRLPRPARKSESTRRFQPMAPQLVGKAIDAQFTT